MPDYTDWIIRARRVPFSFRGGLRNIHRGHLLANQQTNGKHNVIYWIFRCQRSFIFEYEFSFPPGNLLANTGASPQERKLREVLGLCPAEPQCGKSTVLSTNVVPRRQLCYLVHRWHRFGPTLSRHYRGSSDNGTGHRPTRMILATFTMSTGAGLLSTIIEARFLIGEGKDAFDSEVMGTSPFRSSQVPLLANMLRSSWVDIPKCDEISKSEIWTGAAFIWQPFFVWRDWKLKKLSRKATPLSN